jgi:hypothetical protein
MIAAAVRGLVIMSRMISHGLGLLLTKRVTTGGSMSASWGNPIPASRYP